MIKTKTYNLKIIETKRQIEVWDYEKPVFSEYGKRTGRKRKFEEMSTLEKAESIKRRDKYYRNKKEEIRRIVEMNMDKRSSFLTLTQDEKKSNIKGNIEIGNNEFEKFIKRFKRYLKNNYKINRIKYIATWELTKKGMMHYHIVLFSIPFIPVIKIAELWGHGSVDIRKIDHVPDCEIGIYISKYFAKDLEMKASNKKAYFTSRNLLKADIHKLSLDKSKFKIDDFGNPCFASEYERKDPITEEKSKVNYYVIKKSVVK
ncbi:Rep protein [Eubacteriaceae bacterium ES2]|nr:Rep protein [Eubacteriaceae bacterium ES2]